MISTAIIKPGRLVGTVGAISSKSDLHRLLIAASFCKQPTIIHSNILSADIVATIYCLSTLGCVITAEKDDDGIYTITFSGEKKAVDRPICQCRESGSTLRFLVPIAAAYYKNVRFEGEGRLLQRPMQPLLSALFENGARFSSQSLPFVIEGSLKAGEYHIPGNISSQFISGLLFALPLLSKNSTIVLSTELESASYVNMTIHTLSMFGITIERVPVGFFIEGGQRYTSPGTIRAQGDWSNSAFWLAAGAIAGDMSVSGLIYPNSLQADAAIIPLLRNFGAIADIKNVKDIPLVYSRYKKLSGFAVDVSQFPDLAPVLAVIGAAATEQTILFGAARLRLKESDRLQTIHDMIISLGGRASINEDMLIIMGGGLTGGAVKSFNDHRIVMAAAVAASCTKGPVTIFDAHAVSKSYPSFFDDFISVGGHADVF